MYMFESVVHILIIVATKYSKVHETSREEVRKYDI